MPRPKYKPKLPKHVDPAKVVERAAKSNKRARKRGEKPRVVAGTAAARALGIK